MRRGMPLYVFPGPPLTAIFSPNAESLDRILVLPEGVGEGQEAGPPQG